MEPNPNKPIVVAKRLGVFCLSVGAVLGIIVIVKALTGGEVGAGLLINTAVVIGLGVLMTVVGRSQSGGSQSGGSPGKPAR